MRIKLIAVGERMPAWVQDGFQEYAKRLPRECRLELREIAAARRGKGGSASRAMAEEGQRLLAAIPAGARVIALDVGGQQWSTEELAAEMEDWLASGESVALLVGGPDGLAPDCLQRASRRWSLSRLTLPHPLVRVVLAEQLYRAWSVLQGHPYHRA